MKSHEVLKAVIDDVGAKQVAYDLRVSTSLVYKWCADPGEGPDPEASGARNPLDRVLHLCESVRSQRPVEWLCERVGGYWVPSPDAEPEEADAAYLQHTQELLGRFSKLLEVMSDSIANESRIDRAEATRIRRSWSELQSHGEAFVRACEQGLFDPER